MAVNNSDNKYYCQGIKSRYTKQLCKCLHAAIERQLEPFWHPVGSITPGSALALGLLLRTRCPGMLFIPGLLV